MRLAEEVGSQERKQQTCIALHAHMGCFGAHLAPRDCLTKSSPRKASIVLGCRRDVDRAVKSPSVLIPPNHVMLGNTAANHERVGRFNIPGQIAHDLLISQGVKVKITVFLSEHEELGADGTVSDTWNTDGNSVFCSPINQRVRRANSLTEFPNEMN